MIVGLEGVTCTGKTTLAAALAARMDDLLVVPCYYHSAPDPARLPPPVADSAQEQLDSLAVFLDVETSRRARALQAIAQGRDVILDRTVDTLLAHTHAIARMRGFDSDAAAQAMARRHPVVMPDLTLLLRAAPDVLEQRAADRPGMPRIFYDPQFTAHFNRYFRRPLTPLCIDVDAAVTRSELARGAMERIDRLRCAPRTRCAGTDSGSNVA